MNRFWDLIIRGLLEAVEPRRIIEVGVATGLLTARLLAYCEAEGAVLHAIDPQPEVDIDEWCERYGEMLVFHRALSLDVLADIHGADVVVIDGDHNWYTVFHELETLENTAVADENVPPLVLLHDVDWPYGQRDMYYNPETIPSAYRQPHRRAGLVPGRAEPAVGGVNWHLENAVSEGSERNGVRTAIEDFARQSQLTWQVWYVPGFHGLGIAVTADRLHANPDLAAAIGRARTDAFLETLARELELARVMVEIDADRRLRESRELLERQLKSGIEERLAETDRLQELVVDAERRLAVVPELQLRITDLERELETAQNDAAQCQRVLSDVLNSPSWRVTQPLRALKRSVLRIGRGRGRQAGDARQA
jgi:hypothetical protein